MAVLWPIFLGVAVSAAVMPRGELEHVIIADCKSPDGVESSHYAYFTGPPDGTPDAIAVMRSGKHQPWADKGLLKATFPDGTTFSCNWDVFVAEGEYMGFGSRGAPEYPRGWTNLSCYARFKAAMYTTEDGTVCNAMYDCDRSSPPSVTAKTSSTSRPAATTPPASGASTPSASAPTTAPPPSSSTSSTTNPPADTEEDASTNNLEETPGGKLAGASPTPASTSSFPAPAAATSGASDDGVKGLTMDQKISLGVGVGVGVGVGLPALIVALLAWLFPRTRVAGTQKKEFTYRFSHAMVENKRFSRWKSSELSG